MAFWKNNRKFAIGKQRLEIMIETNDRKLPVGIQSFEEIRKGGYLYVDKTDIIWQLANRGKKYNYLSRPRRFGKSVLVDTLEAYFMGKKELFEGLKIMQMETEWVKRPVIRLDMSRAGAEPESLKGYLDYTFQEYESLYEIETRGNVSDLSAVNAAFGNVQTVTVDGIDGEFGFITEPMSERAFAEAAKKIDMIHRIRIDETTI